MHQLNSAFRTKLPASNLPSLAWGCPVMTELTKHPSLDDQERSGRARAQPPAAQICFLVFLLDDGRLPVSTLCFLGRGPSSALWSSLGISPHATIASPGLGAIAKDPHPRNGPSM